MSTHYRMRDACQMTAPTQGVVDAPLRRRLDAIAKRCFQLERTVGFPKNQIAQCARKSRSDGAGVWRCLLAVMASVMRCLLYRQTVAFTPRN